MRRLLHVLIGTLICVNIYSEEMGINYKNLMLNINTHEATLATSEKLTPVYTEIKYNFKKNQKISPFLKGNLGFSYVEDMEDTHDVFDIGENTYYSMGAGVDIQHLSIELLYTVYRVGYLREQEEIDENRFMVRFKYRY